MCDTYFESSDVQCKCTVSTVHLYTYSRTVCKVKGNRKHIVWGAQTFMSTYALMQNFVWNENRVQSQWSSACVQNPNLIGILCSLQFAHHAIKIVRPINSICTKWNKDAFSWTNSFNIECFTHVLILLPHINIRAKRKKSRRNEIGSSLYRLCSYSVDGEMLRSLFSPLCFYIVIAPAILLVHSIQWGSVWLFSGFSYLNKRLVHYVHHRQCHHHQNVFIAFWPILRLAELKRATLLDALPH